MAGVNLSRLETHRFCLLAPNGKSANQQLPFNVQLSMVQSPRLGLGFVVVAISEVRQELALGGTVIVLPPVGDVALGLTSPVIH